MGSKVMLLMSRNRLPGLNFRQESHRVDQELIRKQHHLEMKCWVEFPNLTLEQAKIKKNIY